MVSAGDGEVAERVGLNYSIKGQVERTALKMAASVFKTAAEESIMMDDEFKAAAKLFKVMGSMTEYTQRIKFESIKSLLSAISSSLGEMAGSMGFSSALAPLLGHGIYDILNDINKESDGFFAKYDGSIAGLQGLEKIELWLVNSVYVTIDCKGFDLTFLPSSDVAKQQYDMVEDE